MNFPKWGAFAFLAFAGMALATPADAGCSYAVDREVSAYLANCQAKCKTGPCRQVTCRTKALLEKGLLVTACRAQQAKCIGRSKGGDCAGITWRGYPVGGRQ